MSRTSNKAGRMLNADNEKCVRAARCHFKAIELHKDAGDEIAGLAQQAIAPLDDMLDQLDSDPEWDAYDEGEGDAPGNDGAKAGRVVSKENSDRLTKSIGHGKAIAEHDDATDEISALANSAITHLQAVLDSSDDDAGDDDDGDMSYHDGNPTGSTETRSQAATRAASGQRNRQRGNTEPRQPMAKKQISREFSEKAAADARREFGIDATGMILRAYSFANDIGEDAWTDATTLEAVQDDILTTIDSLQAVVGKSQQGAERLAGHRERLAKVQKAMQEITAGDAGTQEAISHKDQRTMSKDTQPSPASVFGGAGNPRVKRASEQYDSTASRLVYPNDVKGKLHFGTKAGHDVVFEGRPAYESSQLQKAMSGAWLKHKIASQIGMTHLLSDHDRDLYRECVEKADWVGEISTGEGREYYGEPKRLSALHQKTLLNDSTSGGQYAVPYFFDVDLVTFPLLYGELFPSVDLRELTTSNQVKGATLANFTISAGPAEGDSPTISLQTTTGMVGALTTNIYNATGAATIGRDFLSDSPIELLTTIQDLYQKALLQWLDKEIATGDGTTGPLGLFNTSNLLTASAKNSTAGPMTVADIEGMVKTLPKQYRQKSDPVIWVASDGLYFRIRGISVSSTDARRIFGYAYQDYMLASYPFKVENDIAGSSLGLVNMSRYRMWRRKGMEIQVSIEGRTNMLANELLVVARSRWGGQLVDPSAMVEMTNAALH